MFDNADIFSENESQYKIDPNFLSACNELLSKRRDSQNKEHTLNLGNLSEDEAYIMSGLALLGDIKVEQEVLNGWLGGQYMRVINTLVEKGFIQKQKVETRTELYLSENVSAAIRDAFKPELHSCKWIVTLCESVSSMLSKSSKATKRVKPGEMLFEDEVKSERHLPIAKLLSEILKNAEYQTADSISLCVSYLSLSISDNLESILMDDIGIADLLEKCFSTPCFDKISNESKFDAYCLITNTLLWSLRNCTQQETPQTTEERIEQIIRCLSIAELTLNKLPESIRWNKAYRLCLPIVEVVCHSGGVGGLRLKSNRNAALRLCDYVMDYFERIYLPTEKPEEILIKLKYFDVLVNEGRYKETDELFATLFLRTIFGNDSSYDEAISRVMGDDFSDTKEFDNERHIELREQWDVRGYYTERLEEETTPEELREIVDEILADEDIDKGWLISLLLDRIRNLGFEPDITYYSTQELIKNLPEEETVDEDKDEDKDEDEDEDEDEDDEENFIFSFKKFKKELSKYESKLSKEEYWEDILLRCSNKDNQSAAKMYLALVMSVEAKHKPHEIDAERSTIQALMLACFIEDDEGLGKCIERYYSHIIRNLSEHHHCNELELRCKAFKMLNKNETANKFAEMGIKFFEAEAGKPETTENDVLLMYHAIKILAGCIGDYQKVKSYSEMHNDLLGLGFRYEK